MPFRQSLLGGSNRNSGHPSGEAVAWAPGVKFVRSGGRWACGPDSRGLSKRFYPWVDVATSLGVIRIICAHRPPRRNSLLALLGPAADRRLRRVIRNARTAGVMWAVGGDWNELIANDPAELAKRLGAHWFGHRIDGWAVCPRLAEHVTKRVEPDGRRDNHDIVYLTLGTTTTKEKAA